MDKELCCVCLCSYYQNGTWYCGGVEKPVAEIDECPERARRPE